MSDWQPIETAPGNRVRVLVTTADGDQHVAYAGPMPYRETDERKRWFRIINGDEWGCPGHSFSCEATHWMPLPEPPK